MGRHKMLTLPLLELMLFMPDYGVSEAASINTAPNPSVAAQSVAAQGPVTEDGIKPRVSVTGVVGKSSVPVGTKNSLEGRMWARLGAGRNAVDKAIKQTPGATKGYAEEYTHEEFDGYMYTVVCDVVVW